MNGDPTIQFLQLRLRGVDLAAQLQEGRDQEFAAQTERVITAVNSLVDEQARVQRQVDEATNAIAAAHDPETEVATELGIAREGIAEAQSIQPLLRDKLQLVSRQRLKLIGKNQKLQGELKTMRELLQAPPDPSHAQSFLAELGRRAISQRMGVMPPKKGGHG